MIFCANMSGIKTMKRSVLIQFWFGKFNGANGAILVSIILYLPDVMTNNGKQFSEIIKSSLIKL